MNKLDNIRIVLCQTSHPGNIGATARAMKTMGLSHLMLVRPRSFPHTEADALASGATDVLQRASVCETLERALTGCALTIGFTARSRELSPPAITVHEAAVEAIQIAAHQEVALVFGNETSGLSNHELIRCQRLAYIPANPEYASLNLAAAVQVAAYELRLAAESQPATLDNAPTLATHEAMEGFYAHLERTLVEIGFLDPAMPKRLMPRLRRLFSRAGLEKEEIDILRGILNCISRQS
ncbi:MAG: RNA methyltransferase [Methylophilaceae bacterium]|nr:RNA methyltransferase [Methylophilaceae bacterium]